MAATRTIPKVPRLAYGDGWIEDFLPERVLAEGRLVPMRLPVGAPPLADWRRALVDSLERSSTTTHDRARTNGSSCPVF